MSLTGHDLIAHVTGLTTADIRSVDMIAARDAIEVTTWNRRHLEVDGLTLARAWWRARCQ